MSTDAAVSPSALRKLALVLTPVAAVTLLADFLFWSEAAGISVGIFFAVLGSMLLACMGRPLRVRPVITFALLLACCVQSAVELSLSGVIASVALVLALAGDVFQPHLAGLWARVSEVMHGIATAPARWLGLVPWFVRAAADVGMPRGSVVAAMMRVAWVLGPALVLLGIFTLIFAAGNAVFRDLMSRAETTILDWLPTLDLSFPRIMFWVVAATVSLGLFHGTRAPREPRWWTHALPRIPRPDCRLALWQSLAIMAALNGLFFVVNTIDAAYLWTGGVRLPEGVSHSAFVHAGVNSLIGAVLFSAFIIAGIFQQDDRVTGSRALKLLAHLWVLQNLVLIAGVCLRLKLYVDEHMLTEKRVYAGCFLALVAAGFLILARFVEKRRTFNWLLGRNALAAFSLFFVLQFADVRAWIARHNTDRWLSGRMEWIDIEHLASLGSAAWQPLADIGNSRRDPSIQAGALGVRELMLLAWEREREQAGWRGWQWRDHARWEAARVQQAR